MWGQQIIQQVILGLIGLSAGITVAGGLFSFIIELGILSDFADRTHTGEHILLYEDAAALGGILGNIFFVFSDIYSGRNMDPAAFRDPGRHVCRMLGNGAGRGSECISCIHQKD